MSRVSIGITTNGMHIAEGGEFSAQKQIKSTNVTKSKMLINYYLKA